MFRSVRRDVIYPQAEHARLAGAIAAAWGNAELRRAPLPHESFVRGVALHDRGYGELDTDGIGEIGPARWVEIQRRSFAPRGDDPVVDLIVALHVHRLVSRPRDPLEAAALPEMEQALPALRAAAGVSEADAAAADAITNVCDLASFVWCFEEPAERTVRGVDVVVDGRGSLTLAPWPLGVPRLDVVVVGYRAAAYPEQLDAVVEVARVTPGSRSSVIEN